MSTKDRRDFIKGLALGIGGVALLGKQTELSAAEQEASRSPFQNGNTILFQGDSITDAGRSRQHATEANQQQALGHGYAWMAASQLLTGLPELDLQIYNRGISGNKVYQLAERWEQDCLGLKPDLLSILIGVNDIWHMLNGRYDGTVEVYEKDYNTLLERTKKSLPQVKLVVCEPFVLKCGAVDDQWFPLFDAYRAAAKRVADKHEAIFVSFQNLFDEAVKYAPPEHWAKDGVHPSPFGAQLMAHEWVATVAHASRS